MENTQTETTYQNILVEAKDQILYITINREDKMNALNILTLAEIKSAVLAVYQDSSIRGIILTGKGTRAFAAGADIAEFANFTVEEGTRLSDEGHAVLRAIDNCPKPVIAAINGFSLGGGNELAMSAHIRVCSEKAKFGQPEVNLGVIPGYAGTQRLAQLIGKGRALEYLLTGDMIDAQKALQMGLVNHVVPAEELIAKCEEILNKIKTKAPLAIASVIRCVNTFYEKKADGNLTEINEFGNFFGSEDFIEGTQAFLQKRPANFKGN